MTSEKLNRNIIILLLVLFFGFMVFWEQRAHKFEKKDLQEQAQVIENDLWNLDPKGPLQYLKLATRLSNYESLQVFAIDKKKAFIQVKGPEINGFNQLLVNIGLIPKVKLNADIFHNKRIIGYIEVIHLHNTIIIYLYLLLVLGLICLASKFFIQILYEKRNLEIRVLERTKELQESEIRFRSLIEQSPFSTTIYSPDGHILYVNSAAIDLWNIPVQNLQDMSRNYNLREDEQLKAQGVMSLIEKGFSGDIITIPPIRYDTRQTNATKTFKKDAFWVQGHLYPIKDTSGDIMELILIHEDVTKRMETAKELDLYQKHLADLVSQRTSQLAAINKELETFTYSVSHDLKAPLRGIDGYSKLLLQDYYNLLDEDGRLFLNYIRQAADQMNQLITDLLSYSRMERRDLISQQFDLASVIEQIIAQKQHEIETREIELSVDIPKMMVTADMESLAQVLGNLIDNAIKYTQNVTAPEIEIRAKETQNYCILTIKDNGVGFDMKYHDKIFEIFQRLHQAEEYSGTGVGLAIVKKAVTRMQGSIRAESGINKGATFFLELPKKLHRSINSGE